MDKYQVSFGMVFSEQDNYNNGCFGDSKMEHLEDVIILKSATLKGLINKVCNKFNVSNDSILLNSCDEIGRIDVQTSTLKAGQVRDSYKKHQDRFTAGELDLWLNCFIGVCTTIPQVIDLFEVLDNETT